MRKIILILLFLLSIILFANEVEKKVSNPWLKVYSNYKNYNIIISNISKIEEKLKNRKNTTAIQEDLHKKLLINKSKLSLYEKNNNLDSLLIKYKIKLPEITLSEYIFKNKLSEINRMIKKYDNEKTLFYIALSTFHNEYEEIKSNNEGTLKLITLKSDIGFFKEYSENIEQVGQNLLESRFELQNRYLEYKSESLTKHLFTLLTVFILYIIYKMISYFLQKTDQEKNKNYNKFIAILYFFTIFIFVVVRYIDDLMYIITFLSVVAAALTIAMREIILNIAGAIYIFFTSVIRVGNRIMVQFDTKHTVGDIVSISLIKIKLHETDDYTNIKDIKNVGRTIYIPNSYIFTKVFYNYSLKKNGLINDILEFEFDIDNDFKLIEEVISDILNKSNLSHNIYFSTNNTKTAILCIISYEINFKQVSKERGILSISLLSEFKKNKKIKLKSTKITSKQKEDED